MRRLLTVLVATMCALSASARTRFGRHGALHGGPRFHQTQCRVGRRQDHGWVQGVHRAGDHGLYPRIHLGRSRRRRPGSDGIVGTAARERPSCATIDVAYEFTGNAWINYLGHEKPIPDSREQYEAVRDEDLKRNDMVWLPPGPMDDTYALAASKKVVERTGVRTLSQYADLVKTNPAAAKTCVDTEFRARQDGYPGMAAAYGFDPALAQTPVLQVGIIYQATADGDQCDFGEVFTTDGRIAASNSMRPFKGCGCRLWIGPPRPVG